MEASTRAEFLDAVVPADPEIPLAPNGIPGMFSSFEFQNEDLDMD
jgi:hypothetical protein